MKGEDDIDNDSDIELNSDDNEEAIDTAGDIEKLIFENEMRQKQE
jgi:hypothetical protein